MCLYPKKIINKKYVANQKNGGNIPEPPIIGHDEFGPIYDERVYYVNADCGQCIECRKKKARNWQVRLHEELQQSKYAYFITLTFAPKELEELCKKTRLKECNAVAAYAVRHSLERYRKDYKKSLRHWYITELGHEGTERIHLHGVIFCDHTLEFVKSDKENFYTWKYWKYGLVYVGQYCNAQTINYIVKYMHKIDEDHKGFIGQVLCSPGIGKQYIEKPGTLERHKYSGDRTVDVYRLPNGAKVKLPTYYTNKCLKEEEREKKWILFMDDGKMSIRGNNYRSKIVGNSTLERITKRAQEYNEEMGYGNDSKEWRKKDYNITYRMIVQEQRKNAILAEKMRKAKKNQENFIKNLQV